MTEKLTTKQQTVYDLLVARHTVPAIAKKLKVTEGAVYAHIRSIRSKGFTIPGEEAPEPTPSVPEPSELWTGQVTNGTAVLSDPEAALHAALEAGKALIESNETQAAELRDQISELEKAVAEQADQNVKYESAIEALA